MACAINTMNAVNEPNSPLGNSSGNDFLIQGRNSPSKFLDDHMRVRAYSTNNVPLSEQPIQFRLQQPFGTLSENQAAMFGVQDPSLTGYLQESRPRAQTFQNGVENQAMLFNLQQQQQYQQQQQFPPESLIGSTNATTSNSSLQKVGEPLLLDHIDHRLLNWTSTFSDSSLGPTNTLFLSNLPPQAITPVSLANLLMNFGHLLTVRVFQGNESAIVEFENLESAMLAKAQLHHQELLPGYSCLVAFAKIFPPQQQQQQLQPQVQVQPVLTPQQTPQNSSTLRPLTPPHDVLPPPLLQQSKESHDRQQIVDTIDPEVPELKEVVDQILKYSKSFGVNVSDGIIPNIISNALKYEGNDTDLGPLPDPIPIRDFDAPKLREIRKLIDNESLTTFEIEELAMAMLEELPELSSDYLGNTVVQKLFEFGSAPIKHVMLKEVSRYLAQMGAHKNGTWSAQKMISVADTPLQKQTVAESLKPYCAPLFNDQFGNYVIQCSLKFGSPWNNFIFEAILAKFWIITHNRFGARAVRACLESHEATLEQTALVSAAIVAYADHLAIDQNAALLITWFLDTCTLPNRHMLLTPRLVPHLAQLCTHKLASLTILKILNNRSEPEAKSMILTALFGDVNASVENTRPPQLLELVLQDSSHGAGFIFKVLSNPQLEADVRKHVVSQVRKVLVEMNISSYQDYKRLMDEVGLSSRGDGSSRHNRSHSNGNGNGSSRGKNRQNKSPQNGYNNRRSTTNGGFKHQNQNSQGHVHQHSSSSSSLQLSGVVPQQQQQQVGAQFNDFNPQMYITPQQSQQHHHHQQQQNYSAPEMFEFDNGVATQSSQQAPPYGNVQIPYGYSAAHY